MQRRIMIKPSRERGSVLVVVLGLLVIMTLMGTVFLTTISLHRDVAESQSKSARARMAANAGLAHAIGVLRGDVATNTTFDSQWNAIATFKGATGGVDATSMFAYAGVPDPYPNDAAHDGIGKWLALDGAAAVTPSQVITDGNSNKAGQYDEDWKILTNAAGDGAKVRYLVRYAVSMIDLEGRLPINKEGTEATTFSTNVGEIAKETGLTNLTAANMTTLFDKSPPSISWDHASKDYATSFTDVESMLLAPFSISGAEPGPRININTAPKEILKGLIERTKTNVEAARLGEGLTPNATTWADAVITARNTSPFSSTSDASIPNSDAITGYTSVRALLGTQAVSNATDYNLLSAGRLFVGPSRFYRGVVRGQVYDREREEAVAEVNLEFVYYLDAGTIANSHVLFKRWVVK